jgi:hypothetical protein
MTQTSPLPCLGVVIVTYNGSDVICDCLESLLAARDVALRIVVVDNGSPDDTCAVIKSWASGQVAYTPPADLPFVMTPVQKPISLDGAGGPHQVVLLETGANTGFAGGVNVGLATLAQDPAVARFWVLNPDSVVPPETPAIFATASEGTGLMGGRVVYYDDPTQIQIDGGQIRWHMGVTDNINQYADPRDAVSPEPGRIDFITGASMVASRAFYDQVGPLEEGYFLYYEEVDWAQRRGDLPLAHVSEAVVYHKAGTAIGSQGLGRGPSCFSLYFLHRARMRFLWRFYKPGLLGGFAYSCAKAGQAVLRGHFGAAWTILWASLNLPMPRSVREKRDNTIV